MNAGPDLPTGRKDAPAGLIPGSGRRGTAKALLSSRQQSDQCPQCGEADLVPFGAKHHCPQCGYIQPCCNP